MEGLSDKAIKTNYAENKYRYNSGSELQNKEFSDGTGWEMYETQYRGFDPQIGRFGQIDPLAELSASTSGYAFVEDNPVIFVDPLGLEESYSGPGTKSSGGVGHYDENGKYVCSDCGPDEGSNDEGSSSNDEIDAASWDYLLDSFGGDSFGDGDEGDGNFGMTGGGGGGSNGQSQENHYIPGLSSLVSSFNVPNYVPPSVNLNSFNGNNIGAADDPPNGATTTFLVQISDLKHNDFLGGKYSLKTYAGVTIGEDGELITIDGGFTLDKNEKISASITVQGIMSTFLTENDIETGFVIKGTSYTSTLISTDDSYSISWGNTNDDDHIALLQTQSWTPSTIEKILMMSPVFVPVAPGIPVPGF